MLDRLSSFEDEGKIESLVHLTTSDAFMSGELNFPERTPDWLKKELAPLENLDAVELYLKSAASLDREQRSSLWQELEGSGRDTSKDGTGARLPDGYFALARRVQDLIDQKDPLATKAFGEFTKHTGVSKLPEIPSGHTRVFRTELAPGVPYPETTWVRATRGVQRQMVHFGY